VRKLFGIVAALFATGAMAQASGWNLSEVPAKDKSVAGYIYHSSAVGTQVGATPAKVISGLRLVCSAKGNDDPVIAIYWNGMFGNTPQNVDIKVDNRKIPQATPWDQDGPILVKKLAGEQELLQALRTGKSVTFEWTSGSVKRTTIISLKDFNTSYGEFKTSCRNQ